MTLSELFQDLRVARRHARRAPALTVATVLTTAIGLGVAGPIAATADAAIPALPPRALTAASGVAWS